MTYRARTQRFCEVCNKEFWISNCYLKCSGHPGRFCSVECRGKTYAGAGNPNVSELGKQVGKVQNKKIKRSWYEYGLRLKALMLITDTSLVCGLCGCDFLPILEVNHINGGGSSRQESGKRLWTIVIKLADKAKEYFNIRCKVCNQLGYVRLAFGVYQHDVTWENK